MKIVIYFDCNGNRSLASAECGLLIKPAAAAAARRVQHPGAAGVPWRAVSVSTWSHIGTTQRQHG